MQLLKRYVHRIGGGGVGGIFGGPTPGGGGDATQFADPVTGRPMQVIPTDVASAVRQARTGGRFGGVSVTFFYRCVKVKGVYLSGPLCLYRYAHCCQV